SSSSNCASVVTGYTRWPRARAAAASSMARLPRQPGNQTSSTSLSGDAGVPAACSIDASAAGPHWYSCCAKNGTLRRVSVLSWGAGGCNWQPPSSHGNMSRAAYRRSRQGRIMLRYSGRYQWCRAGRAGSGPETPRAQPRGRLRAVGALGQLLDLGMAEALQALFHLCQRDALAGEHVTGLVLLQGA